MQIQLIMVAFGKHGFDFETLLNASDLTIEINQPKNEF